MLPLSRLGIWFGDGGSAFGVAEFFAVFPLTISGDRRAAVVGGWLPGYGELLVARFDHHFAGNARILG